MYLEAARKDDKQEQLGIEDRLLSEIAELDIGVLGRMKRARAGMESGRYRRALEEFEGLLETYPDHERALLGKVNALLSSSASQLRKRRLGKSQSDSLSSRDLTFWSVVHWLRGDHIPSWRALR